LYCDNIKFDILYLEKKKGVIHSSSIRRVLMMNIQNQMVKRLHSRRKKKGK
jgi:hypothetical protein